MKAKANYIVSKNVNNHYSVMAVIFLLATSRNEAPARCGSVIILDRIFPPRHLIVHTGI